VPTCLVEMLVGTPWVALTSVGEIFCRTDMIGTTIQADCVVAEQGAEMEALPFCDIHPADGSGDGAIYTSVSCEIIGCLFVACSTVADGGAVCCEPAAQGIMLSMRETCVVGGESGMSGGAVSIHRHVYESVFEQAFRESRHSIESGSCPRAVAPTQGGGCSIRSANLSEQRQRWSSVSVR
jgi:hypothetical protein